MRMENSAWVMPTHIIAAAGIVLSENIINRLNARSRR